MKFTTLTGLIPALALGLITAQAADIHAVIRVNQIGFLPDGSKRALLMSSSAASNTSFQVVSADGKVAFTAPIGANAGPWNNNYSNVYSLDFSALKQPGKYFVKVEGDISATSPSFQIAAGPALYSPLLHNSLFYFQAQRDGPEVITSVINRQPSHLTDTQAFIYKVPALGKNGLRGGLEKVGGPVDVSGGWFDAGDYLKFVQTASYVTAVMLQTARDHPARAGRGSPADFSTEGRFGLDWLLKMWNDDTKRLLIQVGIGDGNSKVTGDHDVWRLPEADDQLNVGANAPEYFIKYRPVFPAGPAGSAISPNLAGRLAAAFATGYQVFKTSDPAYARRLLLAAEHVYDLATTTNLTELTTTCPHEFYPEDEWRDDMEWGAVELYSALADDQAPADLPHTDAVHYLSLATHWARAYLDSGNNDSINLYDVSGFAHYELCRALDRAGGSVPLEVTRPALISSLKQRLESAVKRASKEPFGVGTRYGSGDMVPHVLGTVLEAGFYDELTGTTAYQSFAEHQLDFVLGANAWGTSFIVGAGKSFPFHMQHQVANISGSLDGNMPLVLGATVDGPSRGKGGDGGVPDGARATPWPKGNPFAPFNTGNIHYTDDVGSYATVEPADDYTIPTALIFARLADK